MADCPSENTLTELLEGRLTAAARALLQRHVDECPACRSLLSDLARAAIDSDAQTGMLQDAATAPAAATARANPSETPRSRRFEFQRKLGQGGMGVVYEAFDRARHQRVACKTLRSLSAEAVLRFKQEFRMLQDVQHPNLVRLGDLVEEDGHWWFTMELVHGVDFLTHAQDEARLRPALAQLAEGLHALHGAGKVHRDIKPQNVLVTDSGRVVILDFGLVGEVAQLDSAVVGTAAYMAPEQAQGEAIEPAADWYSVGVMLYEALTGERPFQGDRLPVRARRAHGELAPPRRRRPEVSADLSALCMELLDPDPGRRPQGADLIRRLRAKAARAETPDDKPRTPLSLPSLFVGRETELQALQDAFAATRAGRTEFVLIEGESGVGKSALVHQFLSRLQRQAPAAVVLAGRCYEREVVPYKAFDGIVDALSRYLKRLPKAEAAALLPRRAATLLQAFPVLGRVEAIAEAPSGPSEVGDPREQRGRVFAALRELLARLGERHPLVLTIDDLQWADADSIAMLGQLLRPPDAPSLLLLATARALTQRSPAGWEAVLKQLTEVKELPLGPLPRSDALALAERLLSQAQPAAVGALPASRRSLAQDLAEESGGHPLFIDALIRHAEAREADRSDPLRLDEALTARIDRLEGAARRLFSLVAVAARPIGQKLLKSVAELDSEEFSRSERMLRAGHLVRGLPPAYVPDSGAQELELIEPYHARVREALLSRLPRDELVACHKGLALALESSGQAEPEELAVHFRGAGEPQKAAAYLLRGAERASQALAFEHAARLYADALSLASLGPEETHRAEVRLGEMLTAAGRPRDAARAFLAAAEGKEAGARLLHKQRAAELMMRHGAFVQGQALLAEVLRSLDLPSPGPSWIALLRLIGLRLRLLVRGLGYRQRHEKDVPQRDLLRIDTCWAAAHGHVFHAPLQALVLHAQHQLLALEAGEPVRLARALAMEALLRNLLGRRQWRRADALLLQSQRLGEQINSPYVIGFGTAMAGAVAFHRGQIKASVELARKAEAIFRAHCPAAAWELRSCRGLLMLDLGMMGRYRELSSVLPAAVQDAHERGDMDAEHNSQLWLLIVYLAQDRAERARELLAQMRELSKSSGSAAYDLNILHGEAIVTFYTQPEQALSRFHSDWLPQLRRSPIGRSQLARSWAWSAEASALLLAEEPHLSARRILHLARKLGRSRQTLAVGQAAALRAAVAHRTGQPEEAARAAALAEQTFQAADYAMHAALARYRRGQYLGEGAGRALCDAALAVMAEEGVKNPDRFAKTLLV